MPPETSEPVRFVPRPHQRAAREAILAHRTEGRPGFLLGDMTGLGKTLSVWSALAAMPERDILIVCPKGGLPQWRRTMAGSGLADKAVTLINYERTKSLFTPPPASTRRSTRARNNELAREGRPKRTWPVVVFDEAHRLRNPYTQQSMACRQLADQAAFAIYMSATAGQAPHELFYLGRLLGHAAGRPVESLADFRTLMRTLGIGRAKGRWTNWSWTPNERDRAVMADLLYKGRGAIGLRRRPADIAGWPEVQRELAPTAACTRRPGASSAASSGCSAARRGVRPAGRRICASARRRACFASRAPRPSPTISSPAASRSPSRQPSWRRRPCSPRACAGSTGAWARSTGSARPMRTRRRGANSRKAFSTP